MAKQVYNFNPGPAVLPKDVLRQVQAELLDYKGTGISILESSHRAAEYEEINSAAMKLFRELMGLGDNYKVLFMGGGASLQFDMLPMNLHPKGGTAAYIETGSWAEKAVKEAKKVGNGTVHVAASMKAEKFSRIPKQNELNIPSDAAYLHYTTNNTIYGCQWQYIPEAGKVPLVSDMSSDIFSREMDFKKFSLIYAGAQKNLGPSGVTIVIIRDDMLAKCADGLPTMLSYKTHADKDSLYNTPPVFAVYVVRLVLEWIKNQGGLKAVEKVNFAKKERIYQAMDLHPDFYRGTVKPDSRSWMNLTLRLPSEDLEKKFLSEAKAAGFIGLKGHRDVGGIRVSLYNALPLEGAEKLADFMMAFKKAN